MVSSEIRQKARESLTGKWGKAALMTLAFAIIVFVIAFICNIVPIIGPIANFVISLPLSYGFLVSFMKLKRNEEVGYTDFITNGFSVFGKVWGVFGNIVLKMILPICLVVVFIVLIFISLGGSIAGLLTYNYNSLHASSYAVGATAGFGVLGLIGFIGYIASLIYLIVKGFLYALSYYILNDNPNMSGKEIVAESERLMKGNRARYFWLTLSFIGWLILSAFTFHIGLLWLLPYVMISMIIFYENLSNKTEVIDNDTAVKTEE